MSDQYTPTTGEARAYINLARKTRSFWAKVDDSEEHGCWPWQGSRRGENDLYGGFNNTTAHRFAWALYNGPIPAGFVVRHRCDNPICVNPSHLEVGTQEQNVRDMIERRRAFFQQPTCTKGHVKSEVGIYVSPSGKKECLGCRKENYRARREREKKNRKECEFCGKLIQSRNLARHRKVHDATTDLTPSPYRKETT